MSAAGKERIEEPTPAAPPRYGLLFAATEIRDNVRWQQGGVQWSPEQNNGGGLIEKDCNGTATTITADTNIATQLADPFVVWAEDHCSTLGGVTRDYQGRARRQLEAVQSAHIANELWLGTLAQSASLDNHWLVEDPEILISAALSPSEALALVDIGLAQMLGGKRGMIHVSPQVLDLLMAAMAITLSGQLWVTAMGNVVIGDAGYPGTKPTAATSTKQWIYATPWISYRLSPIEILPETKAEATNRSINLTTFVAQRLAILQWDATIPVGNHSNLAVLAVETTVPTFAFTP